MRILVTGGAGFIGSHLVSRLIADGHQVTVLDDLSTGLKSNLSAEINCIKFIEGSVLNTTDLSHAFEEVDYVFHLAAAVGVFNIVNNPLKSLLTNIRGTENVLDFAAIESIPVFVTSSSEVY
jgi:UDP-glucose 4-epimerase